MEVIMKRISILLFVSIACLVAAPTAAWAGSHTIYVPPPNGVDDTANIQAGLNACVAYGRGCTVQLAAGRYLTRQLVTYNFQGTFKGLAKDQTIIEAIHPLTVTGFAGPSLCLPNLTDCLWPTLIIFVEGDIQVSDLAIRITAPPGTATAPYTLEGSLYTSLLDGLRFMGKHPTKVQIESIAMEGLSDDSSTSLGGFNVNNGIIYTGELPRSSTPFDYYFLSGSLTVRNSSFKSMVDGVSQDGFLQSSQITIGGSPSTGNHFDNLLLGIDMEGSQSSVFDISYNESSGIYTGMWVVPWAVFYATKTSRYLIHDNKFVGTGQYAEALYLYDDVSNPWIQAQVWNNTIEVQDTLSEGFGIYNTKGTVAWSNTITGSEGFDAIGLWNSSSSTVIGNNVSGFTVDPTGYALIYLDPSTTHDLIACNSASDAVLNQGTNNVVIGCQQLDSAAESVSPAASKHSLGLPKNRPWRRQP
jgi:hypothetical protein